MDSFCTRGSSEFDDELVVLLSRLELSIRGMLSIVCLEDMDRNFSGGPHGLLYT